MKRRFLVALALLVTPTFSCARSVSRSCVANADCGGGASCVASRCEAKVGLPALQKDERRVERAVLVTPKAGPAGRRDFHGAEELVFDLAWPDDDRTIHEAFLVLHVEGVTEPTPLEAFVVASSSAGVSRGEDERILFARTPIERGDEVLRIDLLRVPPLARPTLGHYRLAIRAPQGRVTLLLEEAKAGAEPRAEWYLGLQ